MELGLLEVVAALAGLLSAPDVIGNLVCTAAENLPCRPLTLECLVAGAGGLGVAWPAISNDPPVPPDEPYDERSDQPDRTPREYAPAPPPGYEPPPPQSPQDALNDPNFKGAKEDWARDISDSLPTTSEPSTGESAHDTLIKSIQNKNRR